MLVIKGEEFKERTRGGRKGVFIPTTFQRQITGYVNPRYEELGRRIFREAVEKKDHDNYMNAC